LLGSQADAQATLPSIRNRNSTVTGIPQLAAKGYVAWEQSSVTCITNEFERYLDVNRNFAHTCFKTAFHEKAGA
jgi:hypothetical protein